MAGCGPFVLIANCYSNVLRAEGQSTKAMMGMLIGNLLNIVLDPIMILGFGWNIAGAAIATAIGNIVAAAYYLLYFRKGTSLLSIHPRDFTVRDGVCANVLAIGIPASLASLLMSVSQIVMNSCMAQYGDMAVAGMGVAMKVTMMTGMVCIGLGQGIQPLLGYCVGARLWDRFNKVLKFSLCFALVLSLALTGTCYLFTAQIVNVFLTDAQAFDFGFRFSRILLSTNALFGVYYVLTNTLQAMGAALPSLIVNLSRQGLIYIPALFVLEAVLGITGLAWASPWPTCSPCCWPFFSILSPSDRSGRLGRTPPPDLPPRKSRRAPGNPGRPAVLLIPAAQEFPAAPVQLPDHKDLIQADQHLPGPAVHDAVLLQPRGVLEPVDIVHGGPVMDAQGRALGDPVQVAAQDLEHGLGQDHILLLHSGLHPGPLRGEGPQGVGPGDFPLHLVPQVPDGLPGPPVYHSGHRGMELPLKQHHRLQGALSEDAVRHQLRQKAVHHGQPPQHILEAPHRLGQHIPPQDLPSHIVHTITPFWWSLCPNSTSRPGNCPSLGVSANRSPCPVEVGVIDCRKAWARTVSRLRAK